MKEKEIGIIASDGYVLSATVREPAKPIGFIQINSGTGIPKKFYRHFANFLSRKGYIIYNSNV